MRYLKNKVGALMFFGIFMASCSTTYIRHSDLPELKNQRSIIVDKKGECKIVKTSYREKTIISSDTYYWKDCGELDLVSKKDLCMYFLEGKDVIYFRGSYWINKRKDPHTLENYINKDINFD
ncbi:MAG: hypothetical protein ACJASQ_003105 [Crocinitomicaceae bacterium]|jgi:hypothetical protein